MIIGMPEKVGGGAGNWGRLIAPFLINHGCAVTTNLDQKIDLLLNLADVLPLSQLKAFKETGVKILHRMDGFYWNYLFLEKESETLNLNLRNIVLLADDVVFQSCFIKKVVCDELLGFDIDGSVIYNSADPKIFYPNEKPLTPTKEKNLILLVCNWGPAGLSLPLLKNVVSIAAMLKNEPFEFGVYGYAPPDVIREIKQIPRSSNLNIANLGVILTQTDLANLFRTADILLYIRPNDPCPNLVIEAMHCGIPIVGLQSGSLPELLGEAALLADCQNTRDKFPEMELRQICGNIIKTAHEKARYKKEILQQAKRFSFDAMAQQYLERIQTLINRQEEASNVPPQ